MEDVGSCVEVAINAYVRKADTEEGSLIVRVLDPEGKRLNHWYYRSDESVVTSFYEGVGVNIPEYDGLILKIPSDVEESFGVGRFEVADNEMSIAKKMIDGDIDTFQNYIEWQKFEATMREFNASL